MPKPSAQVTAAEVSRIAGVTRATVSNWRRRHPDFPAPAGGTESSPLYDLRAVRAWLEARGHVAAASPAEELRTVLRLHPGGGCAATRALPLVLAAAHRDEDELTAWAGLPEAELTAEARKAATGLAGTVPGAGLLSYGRQDADLVRALIRCVRDEGGEIALDVLAERELDDSAASGAYQTPRWLADLMARLLTPATGTFPARVLDPACGSGTTLAAAARHGATHLHGQDLLPVQARRSAVALALAAPDATVTVRDGDSLRADAFESVTVDGVLCTPPYGDRDWGHDELAYDPRWAYGLPPRAESELAWVQHALSHLAPGALAVMLLAPGAAARPSGRRVRSELLRGGAVRAVIALPPGAAAPLHIGLHLWVLRRPGDDGASGQDPVLFVDTLDDPAQDVQRVVMSGARRIADTARQARAATDWDRLSETALSRWRTFAEDPAGFASVPGTAHAVPVIDLLDDVTDLTPARHVRTAAPAADPDETARQVRALRDRLAESVASLTRSGAYGDPRPAGEEPRSWRTATVADLTRGAALTLHRATVAAATRTGQPSGEDGGLPEEYAGRAVLTADDLAAARPASGDAEALQLVSTVRVETGDVLLPGVLGGSRTEARVADEQDAGCLLGPQLHLFRPDPERLDSWFLAGFLSAEENVSGASTGSTTVQLAPRRLRVPLLPPDEQRRYGEAFRRLYVLRTEARRAAERAEEAAGLAALGLTSGALLPPDGESS
ncbi:N-6 DNA methylase [Streptomyces sp. JJ36]|uniref:N-6 DNA methylase n=1 Tax=Streptomyces sp. JJ36 TaxID=2736645 RepID=UPI001EFFDEFC|nr:N-6 DNA methylase [Streptomyces sp. JJ36]MCF6521758.1 N-6 DNA methylase [Streptomyces sp. JJ36]